MIKNIPKEIVEVINILEQNNYQAYLVGGCVRDMLLDREPHDYDICTDAKPNKVKQLFDHVIGTGEQHGTMTVVINHIPIEVTTMRKDGIYKDNRRPESVIFTDSLIEDVSRRDFTINSIAIDMRGHIYDYFGGKWDLQNKTIKAVNDATYRFREDALRLMRCVRFACQLGFTIEEKTWNALLNNSNLINNIAIERIREELNKILLSETPSFGVKKLYYSRLLHNILPELVECINFDQYNEHHHKDVFDHTMIVVNNTIPILTVRLAALLHDIGKPKTFTLDEDGKGHFYQHHKVGADIGRGILQRFKYDNKTIEVVTTLIYEHMSRYPHLRKANLKKFITRVGEENLEYLFDLQIADIKGSIPPHEFSDVISLKEQICEVLTQEEPLRITDLNVNGYDLMVLGIPQGKRVGNILRSLMDRVLEDSSLNNKEDLLALVKNMI